MLSLFSRHAAIHLLVGFSLLVGGTVRAQTPAPAASIQRDQQAIDILTKTLTAAGGTSAVGAIKDYSATGTITYFWAGQEVAGQVQVYGSGTDQFRLDATLPNGVRSWAVSKQAGSIRETTGYVHEIPFQNTITLGSLTLPYLLVSSVLVDTSSTIQYGGTLEKYGRTAYQVRVQSIPVNFEPSGLLHAFSTKDFFIDADSFQVLGTVDMVHPDQDFYHDISREVRFSDYRTVNGILIPFSCEETVDLQRTWTMNLATIELNVGLSDATFQL